MSKENIWGDYIILTNTRHTLAQLPEFYWDIAPVTSRDEINAERELQKRTKFEPDPAGGPPFFIPPVQTDVAVVEIAASFAGCKMPGSVGGIAPPSKGASFADVLTYVEDLPYSVVQELWKAVGEVNPTWGPRKVGQSTPDGDPLATPAETVKT